MESAGQLCSSKRTKIVATLGPASQSQEIVEQMILCGVNVFRINFSHYQPEIAARTIKTIRELTGQYSTAIGILGDLCGPRLRIGVVRDGQISLVKGASVALTAETVLGTENLISISHPNLIDDICIGATVLIDDGTIVLEVTGKTTSGQMTCLVKQGGKLSSKRGINLPGTALMLPVLTAKDFTDIEFAIAHDLDFLALSFVQRADDIHLLRKHLIDRGKDIPIIAKIENQSALNNIEGIAAASHGVMVARGDLALEMSIQDIPIAQKRIISVCRRMAVPVITATQMLESMISNNRPTRAEATDIANAILDGTDALMLSGETAIGKYPIETIATMTRIAARTEKAWIDGDVAGPVDIEPRGEVDGSIAYAATVIARNLNAAAIVTHTTSGSTARRVAKHRIPIPVLALTSSSKTRNHLTLCWGIDSLLVEEVDDTPALIDMATINSLRSGIVHPGDLIVITAGMPFRLSGMTNLIKITQIPG